MNKIVIRQEMDCDYGQVFEVVLEAFKDPVHPDRDEHHLVERLRKSEAFVPELSIVAEIHGRIVGYVLFTEIDIGDRKGLALAPVAVLPECQGRGIGSELIRAGHDAASKLGYEISVVLGHEGYYPKFGYIKASSCGIKAPFDVPDENYMVLELKQNSLKRFQGVVEYAPEFFEG